jgi:putative DNA primase/helicase
MWGVKEAASRLGEDPETLIEEFELFFATRSLPAELVPWPDPVDTAELLAGIEAKFRRHVVVSDSIAVATALWVLFTYLVEIAVYAPKLLFTFPERDAGKSTALHVLRWMVQCPYLAVEATGAAAYRIADCLRCTFLLDEADTLFGRSTVLAHIVNESWTNSGAKIPRVGPRGEVMEFDVYGTQAISMKGLSMSDTTVSRCIICMIWPKLPSEVVDDFNKRDDEEFVTLRRKLLRWSVDNAVTLQAATPEGQFNNRIRNNWQLLWAIADLAGGEWPKRARAAALEFRMT